MEIPSVLHLKNKLSSRIIKIFFILLTLAIIPGILFSFKEKIWPIFIFNISAFLISLFMFLYKKSPYLLKGIFLMSATYIGGSFFLYFKGPYGTGILYYFAFICLVSLFMSLKVSIVLNVFSALSILGIGLSASRLNQEWSYPYQASIVFSTHYLLISLVVTFSTHYMTGGLRKYINQQKNLYFRLREERKKTQAALKENKTLYKELHHRVKNNLYIITNLLELHHIQKDPGEKDLRNIINRIHSISLVHDLLSNSEENEKSVPQEFIEEVISQLFSSLATESIQLETDIVLNKDCIQTKGITHLTLIMNEIFTNSIKHAFRGKSSGLISVTGRQKDNRVTMIISDDGCGFDTESWNRKDSLGLELIELLVHQIKGSYTCNSCSSGTVYTLNFPCSS